MIKKLLFIIFLAFSSTYAQTSTAPTYVPKDGLLAYFPFNGNANDASGSGSDGNPTDVTLTTDRFGVANTAYSFNGISSNINALITNIPQNNSPRTISGWFKTNDAFTTPDKYEICIFNYGILAKTQRLSLSVYSKGYLNVVNGPVFSDGSFYVNNFDYSNNDWYFYTLTYDGTKASLFINGEFISENLISLNTTGNTFKIGQRIPGDTTDESFKGKIDDIGIWNRVLTPTEINALYESGDTSSFYTLIPDANFEKKLIALGLDSGPINGKVMTANISSITSLDVSASQISDLTGIESFAALQVLNCRANYLTNLNISKNNALTYLNCSSNRLTNLDLSSNINLKTLSCDNNQLTSLDASSNIALTTLYCSSNSALTNLNVSKNTALTYLKCNANKLTSLNVSNNTALTNLNCSDNKLTNLDVEKNVSLNILYVAVNQLTNLSLSKNVNLTELYCGVNQLTNLDLSKNIALTNFDCSENLLLASLNLKNGKNTLLKSSNLGFIYNPQLTCIQVDDVAYSDANWSSKKDAKASFSTNCAPIGYTLIPDVNFEKKLISLGIDSGEPDGKVLIANVQNLTRLDLTDSTIENLTGIESFKELTFLDIKKNQIRTLDLSSNLRLTGFFAAENKLNNLNITSNILLISLHVSKNELTTLDISQNTKLFSLTANENRLTTLNVSKNIQLNNLAVSKNQLETLDLSKNNLLVDVQCISNKLTSLNTKNLPILTTINCDKNLLTELDISDNIALRDLTCQFNSLTNLNTINNNALHYLSCSDNKITSLDVRKNLNLVALYCDSNQLTNLDISKNILLDQLYCYDNKLTTIDVSNHPKLVQFYCSYNQLTNLDVSNNPKLVTLIANHNQLTSLNLKNGNNTTIDVYTNLKNNPQLTCIQVDDAAYSNANWSAYKDATASFNTDCSLKYVLLPDNNFEQKLIDLGIDTDGLNGKISNSNIATITSLNLSNSNISDLTGIENFTSLTDLDCSNNQLTTLNLNQNLLLETLNASSNQITTLDLSKNTNLKIIYIANNPLVSLNIRNGNNTKLIVPSKAGKRTAINTSFLGLNKLGCIQVDDEEYSNANWSNIKEPTTIYSNTCKTLGLEESIFDKVVIYPNPTKGELHINNILLNKATVYDALGKLIKTTTFSTGNNDNIIHLAGLPKGIYYVYLESEGANTAKKVIVE